MSKITDEDKALWDSVVQTVTPLTQTHKKPIPKKLPKITVFEEPKTPYKLDLHGYTLKDAHKQTVDWVHNLYLDHARSALIVTGKSGSEVGISGEFPHWCESHPLRQWIQSFSVVNGGGAYRIQLKKH